MLNCYGKIIEQLLGYFFYITIGVSREQGSSGVEELEKLFGGWLDGSVQVKMNNLGNTKKSMWHL